MRAFIAIDLPQETKDSLNKLQEQLRATAADVKWVKPQNIHLSLKFLGEIDDELCGKIKRSIGKVAKEFKSYCLRISCIGAFPKVDFPRVIWLGIDKGDTETKQLAKTMEEECLKLRIPAEDRAFSSHITIGRVRSHTHRQELVSKLKELEGSFTPEAQEFRVSKITLFKSTLSSSGPIYEALKEASLKTT